ncbi:unnamed protein product [Spodoptera littoralis]|uniref:Uncharacterized protein n=1 Tax=Spodoptera littoralis TaxID=7109 RepID=A0A9P0N780_SPOLI|nr:unnamed protein product [Spodoptera littoralis]CAH1647650.1 unnamed protein product [Spodoptera littoralis]
MITQIVQLNNKTYHDRTEQYDGRDVNTRTIKRYGIVQCPNFCITFSIQENTIKLTKTKLQRKRSTNVTYKLKLISLLLTLQQLLLYQKYLSIILGRSSPPYHRR